MVFADFRKIAAMNGAKAGENMEPQIPITKNILKGHRSHAGCTCSIKLNVKGSGIKILSHILPTHVIVHSKNVPMDKLAVA